MTKAFGGSRIFTGMLAVLILAAAPVLAGAAELDACKLLTKEEVQAAVGQPTEAGKPNTRANTAGGSLCDFKIGDYGSLNLLAAPTGARYPYDKTLAAHKKMGTKTEDVAGLGDHSFFIYPGYGMVQLNTWKGVNYFLITLMVPGATEAQAKPMAQTIMGKVLAKL